VFEESINNDDEHAYTVICLVYLQLGLFPNQNRQHDA
jgi:hypothetical protein